MHTFTFQQELHQEEIAHITAAKNRKYVDVCCSARVDRQQSAFFFYCVALTTIEGAS